MDALARLDADDLSAAEDADSAEGDAPFEIQLHSEDRQLLLDGGALAAADESSCRCWRLRTPLERALLALCGLLAALLLASLAARNRSAARAELCETAACVDLANRWLGQLDLDRDPCEDFFGFVCARWNLAHPIPDSHTRLSVLSLMSDEATATQRRLLEQLGGESEVAAKPWRFYEACMDEAAIDGAGAAPLVALEDALGLGAWIAEGEAGDESWTERDLARLVALLAELHRQSVGALFDFYVGADDRNSTRNAFFVGQGDLVLPSREYYLAKDVDTDPKLLALRRYAQGLLQDWAGAAQHAATDARAVVSLEVELAGILEDSEFMRDPERTYNKMPLVDAAALAPRLALAGYVRAVLGGGEPPEEVIVSTPAFFPRLAKLLTGRSKRDVLVYLRFRLLDSFAHHLSGRFQALTQNLTNAVYGVAQARPRWERCVGRTDLYLGFLLSRLFVDHAFPGDGSSGKAAAEGMLEAVRAQFGRKLRDVEWMDAGTRQRALGKLELLGSKVAFPDFLLDDDALLARYADFAVDADDYFGNVRRGRQHMLRRVLDRLGQPVDLAEWHMTPSTVNAYYSLLRNEMVFPAAVLRPPLFHPDFPRAVNFGAVGMIMGHELTHGFDDNGAKFDAQGNLDNWWAPATLTTFRERTRCMADQYGAYTAFGEHVNGNLTLGENIADNGGLDTAYAAYQHWIMHERLGDAEGRLPGLHNLTANQLFFVSFASTWCGQTRPEAQHSSLLVDP